MKVTGVTSIDGDELHGHSYELDEYGNGVTKGLIGSGVPHTHTIVAKKMSPSSFDNHTHRLMAGKPGAEES